MKYILLVSHGTMAHGIHSVLDMLVGEERGYSVFCLQA